MLSKKTLIGALMLLALLGGTFWYLHVANAHMSNCPRGHAFQSCRTRVGYGADSRGNRTCIRPAGAQTFAQCSNAHCGTISCQLNQSHWHTD